MRVSVVMPVLDEAERIGAALAALAGFDEVIVADGGSRDGTRGRARAGGARVVDAPPGRARQMNAGAAAARGEVLVLLHADTALPPGARDMIAAAALRPGFAWGRFDVEICGRSRWLPVVAAAMNARSRLTGVATGDQAIFATRAAFDAAGGVPDIPVMEDVALSKALRRIARPACLGARARTSGRRWDGNGAARTIATMWAMRLGYWAGVPPGRLARLWATLSRS